MAAKSGVKKSDPTPYSFKAVHSYNASAAYLVADLDPIVAQGGTHTTTMRVDAAGTWGGDSVTWVATRICAREKSGVREIFITGPDGIVCEKVGPSSSEANVDSGKSGPSVHGAIRDLRIIGASVYATGMRRQVYKRERPHQWVHIDQGVLQPPLLTAIAGFNSIDGIHEEELYAAGFGGEIWMRTGTSWAQLSSPTNVILNKVLAVGETVYICGAHGTLLRGRGQRWEVLDEVDEDLWDMTWFQDQLWIAGDKHLYVLDGDTLAEVPISFLPKGKKKESTEPTVGSLCSAAGVLWSVGRKHVLWTADGQKWTDVTP